MFQPNIHSASPGCLSHRVGLVDLRPYPFRASFVPEERSLHDNVNVTIASFVEMCSAFIRRVHEMECRAEEDQEIFFAVLPRNCIFILMVIVIISASVYRASNGNCSTSMRVSSKI